MNQHKKNALTLIMFEKMKMRKNQIVIKYILSIILLMSVSGSFAQGHKLWYDKPAATWTEALSLGNGRIGAMVYGNPAIDQIQLNEETIWAGRPNSNANPEALKNIPRVRDLVFAGKYQEAQDLATEKVMSNTKLRDALSALRRFEIVFSWPW